MVYQDVYTRATTYLQALTPVPKNPNDMDIGAVLNDQAKENETQPAAEEQVQQQQQQQNVNPEYQDWNGWDIHALKGKGKKGGGKGFQGECWACGEKGHSQRFCPKLGRGKTPPAKAATRTTTTTTSTTPTTMGTSGPGTAGRTKAENMGKQGGKVDCTTCHGATTLTGATTTTRTRSP